MGVKIGDVVIDRTYRGEERLALVVGLGISQPILINHRQGIFRDELGDYFSTYEGLEIIGHIDFGKIWGDTEKVYREAIAEQIETIDAILGE